jgi:hypothetical protein
MIALLHMGDVRAGFFYNRRGLVPDQRWGRRIWAVDLVELGVANATGKEFDEDLVCPRIFKDDVINDERLTVCGQNRSWGCGRQRGSPLHGGNWNRKIMGLLMVYE